MYKLKTKMLENELFWNRVSQLGIHGDLLKGSTRLVEKV